MRTVTSIVVLVFAISGCSTTGVADTGAPTAASTTSAAAEPTEEATEEPSAETTPEPTEETTPEPSIRTTFAAGDVITVTQNDEAWAKVVVDKVKVVKSYKGTYYSDTPKVKGNVFIQARVTYTALVDGVDYNPFDWQVFVADEAVDNYSFVTNGPEPQLSSGTLPKGRKASGYVVYEVAAKGKVLMSYKGNVFSNEGPVFEVVLRSK